MGGVDGGAGVCAGWWDWKRSEGPSSRCIPSEARGPFEDWQFEVEGGNGRGPECKLCF